MMAQPRCQIFYAQTVSVRHSDNPAISVHLSDDPVILAQFEGLWMRCTMYIQAAAGPETTTLLHRFLSTDNCP